MKVGRKVEMSRGKGRKKVSKWSGKVVGKIRGKYRKRIDVHENPRKE